MTLCACPLYFPPLPLVSVHLCISKTPEDEGVKKEILEIHSGFFNCQDSPYGPQAFDLE